MKNVKFEQKELRPEEDNKIENYVESKIKQCKVHFAEKKTKCWINRNKNSGNKEQQMCNNEFPIHEEYEDSDAKKEGIIKKTLNGMRVFLN